MRLGPNNPNMSGTNRKNAALAVLVALVLSLTLSLSSCGNPSSAAPGSSDTPQAGQLTPEQAAKQAAQTVVEENTQAEAFSDALNNIQNLSVEDLKSQVDRAGPGEIPTVITDFVSAYNNFQTKIPSTDSDVGKALITLGVLNDEGTLNIDIAKKVDTINQALPWGQDYNTATYGLETDENSQKYIQYYGDPDWLAANPGFTYKSTTDAPAITEQPQLRYNMRDNMPMAVYLSPTSGKEDSINLPNDLNINIDDVKVGTFTPQAEGSKEAPKLQTPGYTVNLGKVNLDQNGVDAGTPDVTVYKFDAKVDANGNVLPNPHVSLNEFLSNIKMPDITQGEMVSYSPKNLNSFIARSNLNPNLYVLCMRDSAKIQHAAIGSKYPNGTPISEVLGDNGAIGTLDKSKYEVCVNDQVGWKPMLQPNWYTGITVDVQENADGTTTFVVFKDLQQEGYHFTGALPNMSSDSIIENRGTVGF